jgi:hypothetical protein
LGPEDPAKRVQPKGMKKGPAIMIDAIVTEPAAAAHFSKLAF